MKSRLLIATAIALVLTGCELNEEDNIAISHGLKLISHAAYKRGC